MSMIDNLQAMLDAGQDSALLRFTLGSQLLKAGRPMDALPHLEAAVRQDPGYSAAWKLYGKALHETGQLDAARDVYQQGISAAGQQGDIQAVREMKVFMKRVEKALASGD
ncbi:MAG: tetratricopeptide repeat protein [Halobacteria archaeon]|nr:tetratricopeptide repeat protein [Halobacteria archaeon]